MHDMEDTLSSLRLAEHSDLRDRGQQQQVAAQHSRHVSSVTTPPSQVPLHNRYEALQVELKNNEADGSPSLDVTLRLNQPIPCVKTASTKKKKTCHSCRRLPSEGNRRHNMHTGHTS